MIRRRANRSFADPRAWGMRGGFEASTACNAVLFSIFERFDSRATWWPAESSERRRPTISDPAGSDRPPGDGPDAGGWRLRVWLGPLLLLLGGLTVAYRVAVLDYRAEHEHRRRIVRVELEPVRSALSRELFGAIHLMEGVAGLIAVEGDIAEEKFHAFAAELLGRAEIIRNVAVAPSNVVRFVYPLAGNESVIGLDYAASPDQWPSVERMMKERRLIVAGPVQLLQGGVGVIGRSPIYAAAAGGGGLRYWGLTSTVLDFDRLLARTPLAAAGERLSIALRGVDGFGERGEVFWGEAAVFAASPVALSVPLPSGSWQLAATPRGGWPPFRLLSSAYFQVGSALSALLATLLFGLLQIGELRKREVLQRRRAEEELRHLHSELQRHAAELEQRVAARTAELAVARDRAEAADRLKSAFLATMSHELRTPLNSIIGFTGIILRGLAGPLNDEQRKQLGMVQGSARHLLALINDVLDISKIEAGELKVIIAPFDARAVIGRVVDALRPMAEAKRLALRAEVAPEIGEMVSDVRRVEQILLNLLNNAVKFTERGEVTLRAAVEDGRLRVSVADTGIGIEPPDMEDIFRPFQQVDAGLTRAHEGTGLGLAISRRLAGLLCGEIHATSEWGKGSTFTVTLPLRAAEGKKDADAIRSVQGP